MGCPKFTYRTSESTSLKVVYRAKNLAQRFNVVDALASQFPSQSPFMSMDGNPVMLVDPSGLSAVQDEWDIDVETGILTWKSDLGGDDFQFVTFSKEGEDGGSVQVGEVQVIEGSKLYSGPVGTSYSGDFTFGVSKFDLWGDVPNEYLGHYNGRDLANRYQALHMNSQLIINSIRSQESMKLDRRTMVWNTSDYRRFIINKYGTDASFAVAAENGLVPVPAGGGFGGMLSYSKNSLSYFKSAFFKGVKGPRGFSFFKPRLGSTAKPNSGIQFKSNPALMDNYLRGGSQGIGGM
jgi:hypothetical protein